MFKWITSYWYLSEFKRTLADAGTLQPSTRHDISEYLLKRIDEVMRKNRHSTVEVFNAALHQCHRKGYEMRQAAKALGANSGDHPVWNAGALLESWAGALIGTRNGSVSKATYTKIDDLLRDFLSANLTADEIKAIVEAKI